MNYFLFDTFEFIANLIKIVAFLIVIWGVAIALFQFVKCEYLALKGQHVSDIRDNIRFHLGSYLLFGFEVLIAGDLIITLLEPSYYELSSLVVIVIIRTILNYFLNKELKDYKHTVLNAKKATGK